MCRIPERAKCLKQVVRLDICLRFTTSRLLHKSFSLLLLLPPSRLIHGMLVLVIHHYLVFSCQLLKVIQIQFNFQNLIALLVILANKQNCPLIMVMTLFLVHLLILYIMIFGVQHQFPLREYLDILSYLGMIFLDNQENLLHHRFKLVPIYQTFHKMIETQFNHTVRIFQLHNA